MKIGILTFINTINYGASLQAYALQQKIIQLGYDVEIIQYTNKYIERKEKNQNIFSLKFLLRKLVIGRNTQYKTEKFREFETKYTNKSPTVTSLQDVVDRYDKIVVGSDQVWNLQITNNDMHYFLDFLPNSNAKVSYAPSFGNNTFPEAKYTHVASLLKGFSHLSVREEEGRELIKHMSGLNAKVVLDPTLLLNKIQWQTLFTFKPGKEHYIIVYLPHNKKRVFDFVRNLQNKTNLPVVYLSISPNIQRGVETIYDASPEEFLGWIYYADYVVTGSFHGTAFALNFEKQFFFEPEENNSRIGSLVRQTGTELQNMYTADICKKIDYDKVRERLNSLRRESIKWLENALKYSV